MDPAVKDQDFPKQATNPNVSSNTDLVNQTNNDFVATVLPSSNVKRKSAVSTEPNSCHVCNNPAGKHSYYGGKVCTSCRAFFRRWVLSDKTSPDQFECLQKTDDDQQCDIDSKSWKSCKRCRFQKCLQAGMRSTWVLSEPDRRSRKVVREEARKKRREQEHKKNTTITREVDMLVKVPSQQFTLSESTWLLQLYNRGFDHNYKVAGNFYKKHLDVLDHALQVWRTGTTVAYDNYKLIEDNLLTPRSEFFVKYYQSEMSDLDPGDRKALEDANYVLAVDFFQATLYNCPEVTRKHFFRVEQMLALDGDYQVIIDKMRAVSLNERRWFQNGLKYDQMFPSPWAPNKALEARHKELVLRCGKWVKHNNNNSKATASNEIQLILMLLIIMFSADDGMAIRLREPKKVDAFRTKYAFMLYRYLNDKYPKSAVPAKYCQAMHIRSVIREAYEIRCQRIPV